MTNLYDQAYDLEKSIRKSEEFTALEQAFKGVMGDPETKQLFTEFRDTQMSMQEKQMQGEEIAEEEVAKAQEVVTKVQQNELISELIETEQRLSLILTEVSQIITKPLEDLYSEE